jgi:peptidoglycan/xylan/chitin deacetylase (PgdA/CDA1 family)
VGQDPGPITAGATAAVEPGTERDFVGRGRDPEPAEWPNGARLALSFVINYEEGSEYNFPDGDGRNESHGVSFDTVPPGYRNLRVESQYEYGSRAGIWRILRLFDQYAIKTTFHASAVALERNPEVGAAIREGGHEPCSHGWRWSDEPWHLSVDEERRRMLLAIESIQKTCGERPLGWYTRYGPGINTRRLLVEEGGFVYDGNAYNDDLPYFVDVAGTQMLVLPYNATYNDGRYVGIPRFSTASDFVDDCKRALRFLWEEGARSPKMTSIALHPRLAGDPGRASALRDVIEYALELEGVWITRRIDIANWWIKRYGAKH